MLLSVTWPVTAFRRADFSRLPVAATLLVAADRRGPHPTVTVARSDRRASVVSLLLVIAFFWDHLLLPGNQINKLLYLVPEAELRALATTTSEIVWLRWSLADFGVSCDAPTTLLFDNTSAIKIANDHVRHELTKHTGVDAFFARSHCN